MDPSVTYDVVAAHILRINNQIRTCTNSATFNYAHDLDWCCYGLDIAQRILWLANELSLVRNKCFKLIDTLKDKIQTLERRNIGTDFQAELLDGQNTGRPKYKIFEVQITLMLNLRFFTPEITKLLNVSVGTVRKRMTKYGCRKRSVYSTITDGELDNLLSIIISENPQTGYK